MPALPPLLPPDAAPLTATAAAPCPHLPSQQSQFKAVGDQVNATKAEAMRALLRHFQASLQVGAAGISMQLGGDGALDARAAAPLARVQQLLAKPAA